MSESLTTTAANRTQRAKAPALGFGARAACARGDADRARGAGAGGRRDHGGLAGAAEALYATIVQAHLGSELLAVEGVVPSPVERRALASLPDEQARISYLAGELERHAQDGAAVGRILIRASAPTT